jgi:hypothetical protein
VTRARIANIHRYVFVFYSQVFFLGSGTLASLVFFQEWELLSSTGKLTTGVALAILCLGVAALAMKPQQSDGDSAEAESETPDEFTNGTKDGVSVKCKIAANARNKMAV